MKIVWLFYQPSFLMFFAGISHFYPHKIARFRKPDNIANSICVLYSSLFSYNKPYGIKYNCLCVGVGDIFMLG